MHRMLIIADDLSGAADCGLACATSGFNTVVLLGATDDEPNAEVLAIDANSRALAAEDAAAAAASVMKKHLRIGEQLLFKKIDSTLRGHVGAELAATLRIRRSLAGDDDRVMILLAPAFPAQGRTTVEGRQLVHGIPVDKTGTGAAENLPCRSDIAEITRDAGLKAALVDMTTVRSGKCILESAMLRLADHTDVLICDAETDQDLRAIAAASMGLGRGTMWAGSAGLAFHLIRAAGWEPLRCPCRCELVTGPTLFVVGSVSSVSREQVRFLAESPEISIIKVPPPVLVAGPSSPVWRETESALSHALASGNDVVVLPGDHRAMDSREGLLLSRALGRLLTPCADFAGALVATGGESARAVLEAWGVTRLRLMGEVEPGLPLSVTDGWRRMLPVLTKAGGFGTPRTFMHCRKFLHELNRTSVVNWYRGE